MRPLRQRLAAGEKLVSDGAVGTMLLEKGLGAGTCPESFCLQRPEALEDLARQYMEAGADIVHTNTFGGSPIRLAMHRLAQEAERINANAVAAARRAVGESAYVSGSCGPCGRLLAPHGDTEPDAVYESFRAQVKYLSDAGADAICVETMIDLNEAVLAVRAAKDAAPQLPVLATMTFESAPKGFFTVMGVDVPTASDRLLRAGADAVGSNCGNGIDAMVRIASTFRKCTSAPLVIQSNAGLPRVEAGALIYDETPEFMAERVSRLLDLGVSIIGGCCGTTPAHIRAIREAVDTEVARDPTPH